MMHAFGLVLNSVVAYPWARDVIAQAQKIVFTFRSSHKPMAALTVPGSCWGFGAGCSQPTKPG